MISAHRNVVAIIVTKQATIFMTDRTMVTHRSSSSNVPLSGAAPGPRAAAIFPSDGGATDDWRRASTTPPSTRFLNEEISPELSILQIILLSSQGAWKRKRNRELVEGTRDRWTGDEEDSRRGGGWGWGVGGGGNSLQRGGTRFGWFRL